MVTSTVYTSYIRHQLLTPHNKPPHLRACTNLHAHALNIPAVTGHLTAYNTAYSNPNPNRHQPSAVHYCNSHKKPVLCCQSD